MNVFVKIIVGFLAAILGSMGMGGGAVLLLYLSAFTDTLQLKAQGINLVFFIPIAIISVIMHLKNSLIDKKKAMALILFSAPAAVLGALVSGYIEQNLLRKILAAFLLFIGVREIIGSFKQNKKAQIS